MTLESDAPPTPSEAAEPALPPARDDEHALRLFSIHEWVEADDRLSSGAFFHRKTRTSLFIKERLPNADGGALHVGRFHDHGRARLQVGALRRATRDIDGVPRPVGANLVMTGVADPPLEAFGTAHAELTGVTNKKDALALANLVESDQMIEQMPARRRM